MKEKNKFILLGILLFPFIIGIIWGDIFTRIGETIEDISNKAFDKFGQIIVNKLKL